MGRVIKGGGKPPAKKKTKKATKARAQKPDIEFFDTVEIPKPKEHGGGREKLSDDNLTTKHIHFCRRYAAHGRVGKAAREAGMSEDWGTWALKQPPILRKITAYQQQHKQKFQLSAERVIEELCRIAFGNMIDFINLDEDGTPRVMMDTEAGEATMASIKEIEQEVYQEKVGQDADGPIFEPVKRTKIKTHDKIKALDLLGRNLRLWDNAEGGELTPIDKAKKIRAALAAMAKADGDAQ